MGLHYSVNASGADHCSGIQDDLVIKGLVKGGNVDYETMTSTEMSPRKARLLYDVGPWRQLGKLYRRVHLRAVEQIQQMAEAMEAVTGWPMSSMELTRSLSGE